MTRSVQTPPLLPADRVSALTSRIVASSGRSEPVRSPIDGQALADIPQSTIDDVAQAFKRAHLAQRLWGATALRDRAAVLLTLHDLVLDRQDEIMDVISAETGKARRHAFDEPIHLALTARYYARRGPGLLRPGRRAGIIPGFTRAEVMRQPKGVVGVISPWNYPFTMALCDGVAALMAGNAVVAKPDHQTMLSALLGAELLSAAGLPPNLWQVVAGPGPVIGPALIGAADYVCFTGSTATGTAVAQACASRLIGCSLELGGKNPMLVLADADLDRAVPDAVRAVFSTSGQLCVSIERIYVHQRIFAAFAERFAVATRELRLGAGLDWDIEMGPLISAAQLEKVQSHVQDALAHGATVLTGGRHRPEIAPFAYEPTVLTGVTSQMRCYAEETFGPVVALYPVTDDQQALTLADSGEFGLNASILGRDTDRARALARRMHVGSVNVNDGFGATFGSIDTPMGGMRRSGLGRRQSDEGLLRFTEPQAIATQRLLPLRPVGGMSHERWAQWMTRGVRLLTRMGRS